MVLAEIYPQSVLFSTDIILLINLTLILSWKYWLTHMLFS